MIRYWYNFQIFWNIILSKLKSLTWYLSFQPSRLHAIQTNQSWTKHLPGPGDRSCDTVGNSHDLTTRPSWVQTTNELSPIRKTVSPAMGNQYVTESQAHSLVVQASLDLQQLLCQRRRRNRRKTKHRAALIMISLHTIKTITPLAARFIQLRQKQARRNGFREWHWWCPLFWWTTHTHTPTTTISSLAARFPNHPHRSAYAFRWFDYANYVLLCQKPSTVRRTIPFDTHKHTWHRTKITRV